MSCNILSQDSITDQEFLKLMIKHHDIAIKMSKLIQMYSSDDYILNYSRKVIYNQLMEINLMKNLLKSMPNIQNTKTSNCNNSLITTRITNLYPGIFSNFKCDNSHFENFGNIPIQMKMDTIYELIPEKQIKDTTDIAQHTLDENHKLNNKEYVDHMLAHHKSGVELAKLVLKSTNEPKILAFAQNIVLEQEKEMFELVYLYNCIKYSWRNI
jgi:uncharacterized protein (DUF305 family)